MDIESIVAEMGHRVTGIAVVVLLRVCEVFSIMTIAIVVVIIIIAISTFVGCFKIILYYWFGYVFSVALLVRFSRIFDFF